MFSKSIKPVDLVAPEIQKAKGNAILLTGATGFLGAHIAKELIDSCDYEIICPIRGGNPQRLKDVLAWYFGKEWLLVNQRRLKIINGDIVSDNIGLSQADYNDAVSRVSCIIHSAADVRHYVSDNNSLETNCGGTANVIDFARNAKSKLLHISTISVCGDYIRNDPSKIATFTENDFEIGQNWQDNIYIKSKYMAEWLVRDAYESGLDAKIFRVGRLVGRSTDGVFQRNPQTNWFYSFIKGMLDVDIIPSSFRYLEVELTAVDECARSILLLMEGQKQVYHTYNPNNVMLHELINYMRGMLPEVDDKTFAQHLTKKVSSGAQVVTLLEHWTRLMRQPITIKPDAALTVADLSRMNFNWSKPEIPVLLRTFK